MKFRSSLFAVGASIMVVAGCVVWMSRLAYEPSPIISDRLSGRLLEVNPAAVTDLTKACRQVENAQGWVVFVLEANLVSDASLRTYFETDLEPLGLFVESEPGFLRLGLGLGPGPESDLQVPIRVIRRDQRETIVIAVSRDETRVIANALDKRASWPGILADEWLCRQVQIGSDSRELSQGYKCEGCDVQLAYAVGDNLRELNDLLDDLSNVEDFNRRRWLGTSMTLVGLLSLFRIGRGVTRSRAKLMNP